MYLFNYFEMATMSALHSNYEEVKLKTTDRTRCIQTRYQWSIWVQRFQPLFYDSHLADAKFVLRLWSRAYDMLQQM